MTQLFFEDEPVKYQTDDTVAAALVRAGHFAQRGGRVGAEHGHFCGMGACFECLVRIDGQPSKRACMTPASEGMRVERQPYHVNPENFQATQMQAKVRNRELQSSAVEVLVIGAGPAGLRAALAARRNGAEVLVVDERAKAGGQYFKQAATRDDGRGTQGIDRQMRRGAELYRETVGAGVEFFHDTLVWGAFRENDDRVVIGIVRAGEVEYLEPRALIIATGATERPWPVPGWTLPGVMTTGGIQTLLRSYETAPPGPIVLAGNGPLNLQVAAELVGRGAEVAAVVEAGRPFGPSAVASNAISSVMSPSLIAQGLGYVSRLKRSGVPILQGCAIAAIESGKDGNAASASIAQIAPDGSLGKPERSIPARVVGLGYGFVPQSEIGRLLGLTHDWSPEGPGHPVVRRGPDGSTSLPGVFVAGDAGRIGGAHVAMAQGQLAGASAARHCGKPTQTGATRARWTVARHNAFQKNLWSAFSTPLRAAAGITSDTIVCRCEDVTAGAIRQAAGEAGVDVGNVKRMTRAGMGRCQGRYCATVLRMLIAGETNKEDERSLPAPQNPIKPVLAASFTAEKPEWGGHKRAAPTAMVAGTAVQEPDRDAGVVVIGAGIAGVSTALSLAKQGQDVMLLDSGTSNAQASGGNAGSLHVQLLSWDFGRKAEAGGGPAAATLPLQKASAAIWNELASILPDDIEYKRTGGLMVAETNEQLKFLERKTKLERSLGIECSVIGQSEAKSLVPGLSETVLGGAFCPGEGKLNPLLATPALLRQAIRKGARYFAGETVLELGQYKGGWSVRTQRGRIRAGKVVIAAGAWSGAVGRLAGVDIPVHGAPLQMIVTEAAEPMVGVLLAHADRHITLKQAANGNLIIGGGWTAGLSRPHSHPRPLRQSLEGNLWVASHVLPMVSELHVIRSWAAMNVNIDGAPILGEVPGQSGLFIAVTSNGFTLGPLVGQITADLVTGKDPGYDLTAFSLARFNDTAV